MHATLLQLLIKAQEAVEDGDSAYALTLLQAGEQLLLDLQQGETDALPTEKLRLSDLRTQEQAEDRGHILLEPVQDRPL